VNRLAESELTFIDTKASTELWKMAGGSAGLAIGGEYREEKLQDSPDQAAQQGEVLGQGITATSAKRDTYAFYAEMSLPITRRLEAQIAGRYDHYSDYGSSSTPKLGLKFKAHDTLLLRANWGQGFRAPSLPEISPSVATFFVQVNDPNFPQQGPVQISGIFAGNPDLEPEESESWTAGIIWEPNQNFSVGLNWYRIEYENLVTSDSFQALVNAGDPSRVIRDPVTGQIVTVLNNFFNAGLVKTDGFDIEARYRINTGMGRWTTRLNASYVDDWIQDGVQYAGTNGQGTSTIPRVRGQLAVDWDYRALSMTAAANYIRSFYQQFLGASFFTPQDPRFQNQVYPERVPSYVTYDLFAKYQFTKNLSVSGSIVNVADRMPPYDPGFSATFFYDFSIFDPRGRQYRLGATYKF
jgi:iron complex outermembrane receptor protein